MDIFDQIAPQGDIFDEVAALPAPQPKGDIFDQISPVSADVPKNIQAYGAALSEGKDIGYSDRIPPEVKGPIPPSGPSVIPGVSNLTRPFKAQAYESVKALNEGIAGFSQRLDDIARYMSDKTGLDRGGLFEAFAKAYSKNAEYWDKKAMEVGPTVIDEIVGSAVGGAVPGISEFMLNIPYAAASGAAEAYKKGESELMGAVTEGFKRGLLGKIFHAAGALKKPLATVATGGAMATQTASEGGSPEEIAKSAGVGALYGSMGGGKLEIKDIKDSVKSDLGIGKGKGDIFDKLTQKEVIPSGEVNKEGRQEGGQGRDERLLNQPETPIISNGQGPSPKEAPAPVPADRRHDLETRKLVSEMSPEDMRIALLTDERTGLGNKRAYNEVLDDPARRKPVQVKGDVDGLKWINDNYGEHAGDALLNAKADILKEEGLDAYRTGGDEFYSQFDTPEQADAAMKRVSDKLSNAIIEVTEPDGTVTRLKGARFSYGKGQDPKSADTSLQAAKQARESSGDRAPRGERPTGLAEVEESRGPARTGDNLQSDKVEPSFSLTAQEAPKAKAPELKQGSLVDVQPQFPDKKIPTKDAGNPLLDEIRAREAEQKQTSIPTGKKAPSKKTKFYYETHSLADFVRHSGGLSLDKEFLKGEVRDRFSIKGGYNLVNNKTGRTLDQLAEMAWEDGYFPERPTTTEFLDALREDVDAKSAGKGGKVWSARKQNYDDQLSEEWARHYGLADKGGYAKRKPQVIELPEIVEVAKNLMGGKYPYIARRLRAMKGMALGVFQHPAGKIGLKADIFKDTHEASRVLAHEIGHLVDWLPDKDMNRGNVLGSIATLHQYLKTTLENWPAEKIQQWSREQAIEEVKNKYGNKFNESNPKIKNEIETKTNEIVFERQTRMGVLSGKTRAKLRNEARQQASKEFSKYAKKDELNKRTAELYRERIDNELSLRKLFVKDEVVKELKDLTQILKPFDDSVDANFTKYRYSSKELYADAFSTLINDPQLLKEKAPKFTEGLFNYFDRKPEVKALYDEIQNRITDKKAVFDKRAENIQEMFARGEKAYASKLDTESRRWAERFKESLIDTNEAIIRKVREAGKSGKKISPEDNPVFWLEEAAYKNSQIKEFLRDIGNRVMEPLEKSGLSQNDLAEYLFHKRVIHERGDLANPLGHTPETSKQQLEVMKAKLGEEKYSKLVKAAEDFRGIRKETVIPFLKESGMFSPELMKKIEDNEHYATFNVVDFLEEKNGRGAGISSQIFKQYGTLSEITSPFTATVMKDMALVRAANNKLAAEKTIDFLKEHFTADVRQADTEWNGRAQVPVEPKDADLGMIRYLNNGKVEAYYVDKFIADSFAHNPSEAGLVAEVLRTTNIVWKELFVNRNPGFWLFNSIRDYRRAALNLQGASLLNFLPEYVKAIKPAFRNAFDIPDDVVRAMNQKKMLISMESRKGLSAEDTQIERMLYSYGLKESKWNNLITRKFGKIWDYWGKIGEGIEKIPKIGGYNYLKKHTNLSEKELGHIIRTQVGSPDFLRKGTAYNLYNNLFLFSNAIKEGWRGDIEVMRARPAEYAWKTAKYSLIPKLIMHAAAIGLLGAWMKKSMDNTSDFDKTNYITIPMGESENGKGVYFRIPLDETGRFLGGILWKILTVKKREDITSLFDFMAGQAPNTTPTVGLVSSLVQYLSGKNPYDWFRGQTVIPERTFEAGGWRSHKEFLKFMANQAGAGIIYKFSTDEVDKVKTESEKVLGLPILSNIIGRFIKISDIGQRQELKDVAQEARRSALNRQLDVKDRIIESINEKNGKPSVADVRRLYIDLIKEKAIEPGTSFMEFRNRYNRYASKAKNSPKIDAIVNAATDDEKAALLKHYKATMSKEDYDDLVRQLMIEGHLKKGALLKSIKP